MLYTWRCVAYNICGALGKIVGMRMDNLYWCVGKIGGFAWGLLMGLLTENLWQCVEYSNA
jgi:hypothetical protein